MKMNQRVKVSTHYTRSINIQRDRGSLQVLNSYIATSRAVRTVERLAETLHDQQAPRAWSLVGPYGSGKSSFALFVASLLGDPAANLTKTASVKLEAAAPALAKLVSAHTAKSYGTLQILVTGAPEPMAKRIVSALLEALEGVWAGRRGKRPSVFQQLNALLAADEHSTTEIMSAIVSAQTALGKIGFRGIVFIIDELGKFLEYEARHYGANDIYLLQAIAEHACDGAKCNIYLFVMLHQSFEQYAKGLGEGLKNEWSKVQGRFEEVPFIEASEQVLRVVSSAIQHSFTQAETTSIKSQISAIVNALHELGALPPTLKKREAVDLFLGCYPLHPVTGLLLPLLCQKIAQNERTLFSYLGSREEFGLLDMLQHLDVGAGWVLPHHVFDYFVSNQSAALGDYKIHRRWAEVTTALARLGDAPADQSALLKTIGVLNIVGAKGGFKPSTSLLQQIPLTDQSVDTTLTELIDNSLINYRSFNKEYRVWEGSDFDLEDAVQNALDTLGEFDLAKTLNEDHALAPVVARRYTIRSGSLRYFTPVFIDARNYSRLDTSGEQPRLLLYLSSTQDDEKVFLNDVTQYFGVLDILAICKNGPQLREATAEVIALRFVGASRQELNADAVAKREFQDRLAAAENAQSLLLASLLDYPAENAWYHGNDKLAVTSKRTFQECLSTVLEGVFHKSPELHNELVNRDKPSSQANAGRTKLLHAMLSNPGVADLGIVKFPPEKAIYRSLLKETGLHREAELSEWLFCEPEKGTPFYHVWLRINQFLDETDRMPKSFVELNQVLMRPPYGMKAGVLPILYVAVYCVYQHELALYEGRRYQPIFSHDMLDRFVKRPDEFTIQRFKIKGLRASIYAEYKTLFTDDRNRSVVELVRPLATLIGDLEDYTQRTRSSELSEQAKNVRDAFNYAKSPERLLFEDLPKALGFEGQLSGDGGSLEGFAAALQESLKELKYAYARMLESERKLIAHAFHMDEGTDLQSLRRKVIGRYEGLEQYTVDVDGVRAFIKRITKRSGTDIEWLENILMFLGQKPSKKWTDADRAEAEIKLTEYAKKILDLETLRLQYDKHAGKYDSDFEVILLKSLRKGREPIDEVVAIDRARHESIAPLKNQIWEILDDRYDNEIKLAILAEIVDEFLVEYREDSNKRYRQSEIREEVAKRRIKRVK